MCMIPNKAVTEGGLECARSVLEKAYGEQAADDLLNKVTRTLKNREFAFMNKADVKSLYSALQNERPQTIALVLSYVEAERLPAWWPSLKRASRFRWLRILRGSKASRLTRSKSLRQR